ncbi:MAG TPA: LLM class flavin-dependent oxidoreductase [Acidimicrobiales bacterium]
MALELWTTGIAYPTVAPRAAARAEAAGWDGMLVVDSQNLSGDPYVALALAARETTALRLGTGVTNPAMRHPAAAAAAIASVHVASAGRAVLGVGRGDSALAHIGLAPAPLADLERFVVLVRAYLGGRDVSFDDLRPYERDGARPIDVMGLADRPVTSRLHWLPRDLPPVPVDVVATGPKALALAGRRADRTLLAVGADAERVAWAAGVARDAGAASIGAFVNVVAHDDISVARRLGAGGVTTFARFSAMDGTVRAPIDDASSRVLQDVHRTYDMHQHTRAGSPQATRVTAEFADRFAILGPPDHCIRRLRELAAIGIDRFVVVGPSIDADRDEARRATQTFANEVLPAIKESSP